MPAVTFPWFTAVFETAVVEDGSSESPAGLVGRPRCRTGRLGSNSSGDDVGLEGAGALACCVVFPLVEGVESDGGAFKTGLSASSSSVVEEPLLVVCCGVGPVSPVSSPGRARVGLPPELAVLPDERAVPLDEEDPLCPLPDDEVELPVEDDGALFDPLLGPLPDCELFDEPLDPGRRSTGGPASASPVMTAPPGFLGWRAASFAVSAATLVSSDSCGFH